VEGLIPPVAPAVVLSILVGAFQACLYVVIRGTIGKHLPLTLVAAIAGSFVGHLVGRLAGDPVQLGDFNVLWASVGAWLGIILVAGIIAIRPSRPREPTRDPRRARTPDAETATTATGTATDAGTGGRT
jgi:hypothetical protein